MASTALEQQKRYEKLTNAAADAAPPWAAKYIRMLAPITGSIAAGAAVLWPYLVWALETGYRLYLITPTNLMMAMVGLVFCFFGGTYPVLFAAIEAARLCGWEESMLRLRDIKSEAQKILRENEKDNQKDDDGDGKMDVEELDSKALLLRKTNLIITKCDPGKINAAVGSLWLSWIGVVAVLKVQFAQTITMALSIADYMQKSVDQFCMPVVRQATVWRFSSTLSAVTIL